MASFPKHTNSNLDTSTCPLCGEPNLCAQAADPNATECWCESEKFPENLIAQIPDKAVRKTWSAKHVLMNTRNQITPSNNHQNLSVQEGI